MGAVGATIKKIDTIAYYVFLSLGFATLLSYGHNYPSAAANDLCVVVWREPDKCGSAG